MVDEYGICKISDFKMSYRLSADDDYEVQVRLCFCVKSYVSNV